MATEQFSYLAHPDIIAFEGERDFYLSEMSRIIRASQKYGMPLEFNLLGLSEGRCYPSLDFWRLVGSEGLSAVIGCDAHSPSRVADKGELSRAKEMLTSCGVKVLERVELRRPRLY